MRSVFARRPDERAAHLAERRKMMQLWADYLDKLKSDPVALEISSVSVPAFVPRHSGHDYLFVVCHLDRAGDAACPLNRRLAACFTRLLFVFHVAHLPLRA
jgi:hypothetical protein